MTIATKLRHLFTPHHTNNFRAKMLHNSGIFAVIGLILAGNVFIRLLNNSSLDVLGFTSSVTIDEVVRSTNQARVSAGLAPLSYNEKLADAARRKASNMLTENYWAHNAPSGKSPWVWFNDVGYKYLYAGENLAKDFGDTGRMMSAWMASPTHKENIVNPKYSELGIAVVPGSLQGSDTVLVVQLFGAPSSGGTVSVAPSAPANKASPVPVQVAEVQGQKIAVVQATPSPISVPVTIADVPVQATTFNEFNVRRFLNLGTTLLFILALILDLYIAESQKISRRVGNNWGHIVFINFILLAIMIVNAGKIL